MVRFYSFVFVALMNTILSMFISLPNLQYSENSFIFKFIPFVSNFFALNLGIAFFLYIFSYISGAILIYILSTLFYSIFQLILVVDTKIFSLFRFHINSLVLNVITTEGFSDSVTLGKGTFLYFVFISFSVIAFEIAINLFAYKLLTNKAVLSNTVKRIFKMQFVAGLLLIIIDKCLYAYGDIVNRVDITSNSKLFFLYQPLTIKGFISEVFGVNVNREEELKFSLSARNLKYPKRPLRFDHSLDKKYNIVIVVIEGLRFDMLDPEIMPELWKFSKEGIVFTNHYSGGNASRFGIFTLLYGINGTYWHTFLANRVSPILIDTLIDKGYEFLILSSTRLTFPEFRRTAFVRLTEFIVDTFDPSIPSYERDRIITDKFIDFISKRNNSKPFFSFIFFDSSHQPYLYPDEYEKFKPVLPKSEINYFKDVSKDKIYLVKNRYKNAIYYEDYLIGKIIRAMKEKDLMENTIFVVTGDHGEEFYEEGYLGHTSSFDDYQIKVVFILFHPEAKPEVVEDLSSHLDLVPTIMDSLGVVSPYEDYSQGISLLKRERRPYIIISGWDKSAIIDDECRIIFSTESYNIGLFEIRSRYGYKLVNFDVKKKVQLLREVVQKLSEFYR